MKYSYREIKEKYDWGARFLSDPYHLKANELGRNETKKRPFRYDIINYLLSTLNRECTYLEIGVRNPNDNFNKIQASTKYSVDPGLEYKENPVDFKLTSDVFFDKLRKGNVLEKNIKFDTIFIDGLHLADQVDRDIENALEFIKNDGFIVLHDCNPPSEWHAREQHQYRISPAMNHWNGTTWKSFVKWRQSDDISSCCIDTDWGVGIISKAVDLGAKNLVSNPFFEFSIFKESRKESLNLISFTELQSKFNT